MALMVAVIFLLTVLVGLLEDGDGFPTAFAYFEKNVIADANEEPYNVH